MNRLHINGALAFVLLSVATMAPPISALSYEPCQGPATGKAHLDPDAMASAGKSNDSATHCLVYGKYCLGEVLRGRAQTGSGSPDENSRSTASKP